MFPWRSLSKYYWLDGLFRDVKTNYCSFASSARYIDEGRNPQLYTKDCMEKALTKNELVKGKMDSYR